jgi:hypothetical protein
VAAAYNLVMMLALGLLYIRYSDAILGFFDSTPAVLQVGREYLGIVALSYAFLGVGVVLSQAMTGAGATLSSLVLDGVLLLGHHPAHGVRGGGHPRFTAREPLLGHRAGQRGQRPRLRRVLRHRRVSP